MRRQRVLLPLIAAVAALVSQGGAAVSLPLDNLTYLDDWNPVDFVELLDVWIGTDDLAYVTGVGGLMTIDISDPTNLQLLDKWTPLNHPDDRLYMSVADEDLDIVYAAGREDGLYVFSTYIPTEIELLHKTVFDGVALEGLALTEEVLYGAAHGAGVMVFVRQNPLNPFLFATLDDGIDDAWRLEATGGYLYVADGQAGVKVVDISDGLNPVVVHAVPTSGPAKDLRVAGDRLLVAAGTSGMDIIDIADPPNAAVIGNYSSGNSVFDVAARNDLAYLATWNRVDVVDFSGVTALGGEPALVAYEDTPGRSMGVGAVPASIPDIPPKPARVLGPRDYDPTKVVYVTDWYSFRAYEVGPAYDRDLHVEPRLVETASASPGTVIDTTYTATNTGGLPVEVTGIDRIGTHSDDWEIISPTSFTIPPGGTELIHVRYTAGPDTTTGVRFEVASNDPDEPIFAVNWDAGFGLNVGDPAPDFALYDLDGVLRQLSDFKGTVIVLAFFASW